MWETRNSCLIDFQIPTGRLGSFIRLANLLLLKPEDFAVFGEIIVFICEPLKMKWISSVHQFISVAAVIGNFYSFLPSTRLVIVLSTESLNFVRKNLKLVHSVLKDFVFDWEMYFLFCEFCRFENLVGLELPIKHTLTVMEIWTIEALFTCYSAHKYFSIL